MTSLAEGTPEYGAVFDGADIDFSDVFTSYGPTYALIQEAFSTNPAAEALLTNTSVTNANQASDVRRGMCFAVYDLVVELDDQVSVNLPAPMLRGAAKVIQSRPVGAALTEQQVGAIFSAVSSGDPKKIAGALIGAGLAALSVSLPVVGVVAAAIIGLAAGIASAFRRARDDSAGDEARRFELLAQAFPELQIAGSELDGGYVQSGIRPALRSRNVTAIWLPQFDGEVWVGAERKGGFAFAPGEITYDSDQRGQDIEKFLPSARGGLGVIPGSTEVTSTVQASLPFLPSELGSAPWLAFAAGVGPDPRGIAGGVRGWTRVKDTGLYLPATGRIGGSIWDLFTATADTAKGMAEEDRRRLRIHGNSLRYRIDIPELDAAWKRWAAGGLRFIREKCYPWYAQFVDGLGRIAPDADLEGFMGTCIFLATGVWGGIVSGGSSTNPTYAQYPEPNGFSGPQLAAEAKAYGWPGSSVSSSYSGAFLPITDPSRWPDELMHDRYHRGPAGVSIKGTLDSARQWQEWELGHTLVSAYVSAADAAFVGDEKLLERLWRLRATLLQHGDRMAIDMRDVPADELGVPDLPHSDSWREQLLAAGVPEQPSQALPGGGFKLPGGGGKPPSYCEAGIECDAPAPAPRPPFQPIPANPWEPGVLALKGVSVKPKRSSGGFALAAFAGAAAVSLGAALVAAQGRDKRPNRSFSAGGLP